MPRPSAFAILRLDDQVGVIPLQGVVHEPEPRTLAAGREGALDLAHDAAGAIATTAPAHGGDQREIELRLSTRHLTIHLIQAIFNIFQSG
jgi:hypothetical protein